MENAPHGGEFDPNLKTGWFGSTPPTYWLTRFLFLRGLGFIYAIAFLILVNQGPGLLGSHGLLPATRFVARMRGQANLLDLPSVFLFDASDAALMTASWAGLVLAVAVMLFAENAVAMAALWALYLSFVDVGQIFYGYGWEMLLLEAGFLSIFLCPLTSVLPLSSRAAPSPVVIVLLRWLLFRVMFGAGLIKLRGDACWTQLTCLAYHYETQPVPGPWSPILHRAPLWFHEVGVAFNHGVELVAPWFVFGPRALRLFAGACMIGFQAMLVVSGNLSFLNWLTIVVCVACFDDVALARALPQAVVARARAAQEVERSASRVQVVTMSALSLAVALLSVNPIANMLSSHQVMNRSFDPLHLVNTYGAFGSVSKVRHEVIIEGTRGDATSTRSFRAYEFKCKPGDVQRRPCLISPYHYRLDWQMWFAGLSDISQQPWLLRFVYKLLRAEPVVRSLLAHDPFGAQAPRYIRAELYEYHFAPASEGAVWRRKRVGEYLRPISVDDPALRTFLAARDWLD
jgi:hypothetical protein